MSDHQESCVAVCETMMPALFEISPGFAVHKGRHDWTVCKGLFVILIVGLRRKEDTSTVEECLLDRLCSSIIIIALDTGGSLRFMSEIPHISGGFMTAYTSEIDPPVAIGIVFVETDQGKPEFGKDWIHLIHLCQVGITIRTKGSELASPKTLDWSC